MKKYVALFITIVLGILLSWDYHNFQREGYHLDLATLHPTQLNSVSSAKFTDNGLNLKCDTTSDAFLVFPVDIKTRFWKRLQIDLRQLKGVLAIDVFPRQVGRSGFSKLNRKFTSKLKQATFTWYLPPGEYSELRIDFDGYKHTAKPIITDIRVKEFSFFFSCELYLYILALLILGLMILPGSLIYANTAQNLSHGATNNLLYLFCNSLIFYFILYLFEIAAIKTGLPPTTTVVIAFILFLGGLFLGLKRRKRASLLRGIFKKEKNTFIAALLLVLISCMFVTKFAEAPFTSNSVNFHTLSRHTIFSKFGAHDNQFQYINGKAIADDEPFSKYYRNKKLTYDVQDRGILAGVIYSVFRTFLTSFSPYIGGSYLTYTIVGICMNVMVIFPLIVLFRRYFSLKYQNVFILLLCLNTFVLPNFYYTWFKFSGAALFISGVLLLLDSRKKVATWMVAGFMFGLASSMHAGNALAIPLMFLWFAGLNIFEFGFWCRQVFIFPVALSLVFILVNLPWSIVKALHFPDTHILVIQHFFLPAKIGPTLGATIINFFAANPLQTQLEHRMSNVIESARLTEFAHSFSVLDRKGITEFIQLYNNYQFFYFMFSVVPLFCIALIGNLGSRLYLKGKKNFENNRDIIQILPYEAATLFTLSFLTIIGLIFVAYSHLPDLNHALPAGPILIIHTLLIGWILKTGRIGHLLIATYAVFSAWRMITHSLLFIFI